MDLTLRIRCGAEIAMGPGKADLLEAIRAHGSISAAARAMDMSYRRAWLLVDTMNRCWNTPLVATVPGRAKGGSAWLTDLGDAVLGQYRALQADLALTTQKPASMTLLDSLLPDPRASQPR